MSESNDIIADLGEAFDEIRADLFAEGARCFLVKRREHSQKWVSVTEIAAGWLVEFSEYRNQMVLQIAAANETGFENLFAQAGGFAYGVPDADGQLEVFAADPERRDAVAPNGTSPFWKIYGEKAAAERFNVPGTEEETP